MTALLKDRYKLGILLATIFFAGILISLYQLFTLPDNLMLTDTFHPALIRMYMAFAFTCITGGTAIWFALQQRNEVIVYRDKQIEKTENQNGETNQSQTTISLESVKSGLKPSQSIEQKLQTGLQAICKQLEAGQGAVYLSTEEDSVRKVELKGGYALSIGENTVLSYTYGEGLVGQAASGGRTLYIDEVPDGYIKIISGLGSASPRYLLIVPVKNKERVMGVIEIASFTPITEDQRKFVEESAQLIGESISRN